jgi:Helicase conserved C-terminal domain
MLLGNFLSVFAGSGKTLPLFLSIAYYDGGHSTLLILPLQAMHDEYKGRASKHGLSYEVWANGSNPSASPQIILVAVESCVWEELKAYVATLILLGRLARIVVDEAHLLLKHASFRPCVNMLEYFGRMPTPMLLMTATCPHKLEKELFSKLGRQIYQVLRIGTDRPEIAHKMIPVHSKNMEETVAANIVKLTEKFRKDDRALLFCLSHEECDRMAELLGWKPYHASIPLDRRSDFKKMWAKGEIAGLACTSMLNCCLDYPSVRIVFHLGPPRDAIDYYQALGRAARNGEPGLSIVYFDPSHLKVVGDDPFGRSVIYDMLRDESMCRRLRPVIFLDGIAVPCSMLPGAQLCDVCEIDAARDPPEFGPVRFPSHLIPAHKQPSHHNSVGIIPALDHAPAQKQAAHRSITLPHAHANPATSNQPAPLATFGNHFAAAQAVLKRVPPSYSEECGLKFRAACRVLAHSCVYCWSQALEYQSHRLSDCPSNGANEAHPKWKKWGHSLKLPVGYCFFCGFPRKVHWFSF